MTNNTQFAHSASGASTPVMDAGSGNLYRQFSLRVVSPSSDSVVALETSADGSTGWAEQARVTGDGWCYAGSSHRQRAARSNVITLGSGGTGVQPPAAPATSTAASGGTVLAGTYQAMVTYQTANGETPPSPAASRTTSGSTSTLTVNSPGATTGATGWNLYVTQAGGSTFTKQNASPLTIGANQTLTAPPTSTGAAQPAFTGLSAVISSYS